MSNRPDDMRYHADETPVSHPRLDASRPSLPAEIVRSLSVDEQAGFFHTLIDSSADAIIAHRFNGQVVYANSEAAQFLGYDSPADLLTMPQYGWIDPAQLPSAPRRTERIMSEGTLTFESGARCKDGSVIPTEVRARRVDTPLGSMIVAVIRDISAQVKNREVLEHLAYHDSLTDLSNRVHLEDRLAIAIADARRYGDGLAMAYIDLDHFKPVNDRYGHAAGDKVLIEVAGRLRESVREQDTIARLGGDEFVILFPRITSQEEPRRISARLIERICEPITVDGHEIQIGASVGVALFDPSCDDGRSLLVKADIAMYSAKRDGKRSCLLYDPAMPLPEDFASEDS